MAAARKTVAARKAMATRKTSHKAMVATTLGDETALRKVMVTYYSDCGNIVL